MKTVTVVPSVLESKLTGQGVRTETRMSRAELKGLFADGSRWKLVNCLLGPCDRLRIVSRPTSYGFLFMTDDGRESSLRFETGDYIVLGQRDGKPEITIYSKDGRLSAQYIPAEPERIVTLKCEDDSPSYDQRPRRIIVKDETPEKWIGWPEDWRKRGVTGLEPIEWPKFAWKEMPDEIQAATGKLTRDQLVRRMAAEYREHGQDAATALFDKFIKEYGISQFGIKTMIIEFRQEVGIPLK